jgi:hypothetical protein
VSGRHRCIPGFMTRLSRDGIRMATQPGPSGGQGLPVSFAPLTSLTRNAPVLHET